MALLRPVAQMPLSDSSDDVNMVAKQLCVQWLRPTPQM